MKWLRKILDDLAPHFESGGKLEKFAPVFEATDTILFSTDERTISGPHIRDSIDIKRVMILVVIALVPCYIFGAINIGYQKSLTFGYYSTWFENLVTGLISIVPIIAVTFISGAFWELLFGIVRKHSISEGFLVTCALIPLTLPPSIPLWQVAVATSFGIVIGKEIFGGVGMNIFNPALMARAFLYFTYPVDISGDKVWALAPDGYSGPTALSIPAGQTDANAVDLLNQASSDLVFDFSWMNMFQGWIPGSIGGNKQNYNFVWSRVFDFGRYNQLEGHGWICYRFICDGIYNEFTITLFKQCYAFNSSSLSFGNGKLFIWYSFHGHRTCYWSPY